MKIHLHMPFKIPSQNAESESAQFGRDARKDWKVVFLTFVALNIAVAALSTVMYFRIDSGDIFLVDKKEPITLRTLNRFDLEKTVAFFEAKRQKFEALKRSSLQLPDSGAR